MTGLPAATRPCRIGPTVVRIHGLPSELACLGALPSTEPAAARLPELIFSLADQRDWEPFSGWADGAFQHACHEHAATIDLAGQRLHCRHLPELSAAGRYMLLRDVFCGLAAFSGDVLVHGSAVLADGGAYLFCGPSGIGKSTIARMLAPRAEVVNDEINWLFADPAGDGWHLVNQRHWQGIATAHPEAVPLRDIHLLQQAPACRRLPAEPFAAFSLLLAAPYGGDDPFLPQRAAATSRLTMAVPAWHLAVALDPPAVRQMVLGHD